MWVARREKLIARKMLSAAPRIADDLLHGTKWAELRPKPDRGSAAGYGTLIGGASRSKVDLLLPKRLCHLMRDVVTRDTEIAKFSIGSCHKLTRAARPPSPRLQSI